VSRNFSEALFPQIGVVTSINSQTREAKVFLPLFNLETKEVPIPRSIAIKGEAASIRIEGIKVEIAGQLYDAMTDNDTQAVCKHTDGLQNGSQVVIAFISGDIQDAVIIALI